MRKIKQYLLIIVAMTTYLGAQSWTEVLEPEIKSTLNDIEMISTTELWVVGNDGLVLHTTDGFATFEEVSLGTETDLAQVFFIDENNGWIGSEDGLVYYTTDGGANWGEVSFAPLMPDDFSFSYFDGLYFVNDQLGFALAGKYKLNYLYKTTDGGLTWAIKDSLNDGSQQRWYDIKFYDENIGVVAGNNAGTQRYTTDGGETWAVGDSAVTSPFGSCELQFLSENEVLYIGQGNEFWGLSLTIFKSFDGGKTWEDYTAAAEGVFDRPEGSYFKDSSNGIIVGSNGFSKMFIFKTEDGGETWTESMGDYSLGFGEVAGEGDLLYALGTSGHILKSEDFGDSWEILKYNTASSFESMQFVGNKGYTINRYSDVLVTENGVDWEITSSAGLWNAGDIHFIDESTGIAVKENAAILKTTDGGNSWYYVNEPVDFSSTNKVGGVSFGDEQTGYAWFSIGDYGAYRIYKTTDAGETWSEVAQIEGPGYITGGIEFFDSENGFIAGPRVKPDTVYYSWIKYTEDGGQTWSDADLSAVGEEFEGESFDGAAKIDENSAIAVGGKSILRTDDKGKTWTYVDFNQTLTDTNFYRVAFNGDIGIVTTYDGEMLVTYDGGESWELNQNFYDLLTPNTLAVTNDGRIFFGTNDGHIYAYYDPTGVDNSEELNNEYELSQNYPNPFNPATTLKFTIPKASKVDVSIYNIIGQKVLNVTNDYYEAGTHELKIDASQLSSGVYFYQLTSGSYQVTKKMTLIK